MLITAASFIRKKETKTRIHSENEIGGAGKMFEATKSVLGSLQKINCQLLFTG